ncbi:MAG: aminotransferase class I/II-fold pyridoxal phosphate-dependent enzyme [Candidatus Diapherotrites archaeon]|nr:aminotransferase class I/II-fold pyridoxal phosphate-dependent enzyme [Candidatus Diapherotrites archaeon]
MDVKLNSNVEKILNVPYPADIVDQNKEVAIRKFGKDFIVDFGVGDPTDETPEFIRKAIQQSMDTKKTQGYPISTGALDFREAVVSWFQKRFQVSIRSDDVIAVYGAKFTVFQLPSRFITPNQNEICLIPNPGYPPYLFGTLMAGAEPYFLNLLPENNFEPDLNSIPQDILKRSRILFLTYPHSPTGKMVSKEYLQKTVDFCLKHNLILVSDECYSDIYFNEQPVSILNFKGAEECALAVYSFSKRSRMTSYAAGFLVSKNPKLLTPFKSVLGKSIQGLQPFISDGCIQALQDEKHVKEMNQMYIERMNVLVPALKACGFEVDKPDGAFYLWARVPQGLDPVKVSEKLLMEKGINSMPGPLVSHTFNGVNPGAEFIRFALVASLEKTKIAAERLKGYSLR